VLKNEFYYWKANKPGQRDLLILIGDSQSVDPEGHYEIVECILDYLEKVGVKDVFTLAGLNIGEPIKKPRIIGAVSEPSIIKQYEKYGIDFEAGSKVGTIVGAAGLLLGLGRVRGMKGVCLLGETIGFPIIPDHKSAEAILQMLMKILNVSVDTSKLERKIKEMDEFIKKVDEVQHRAISELLKSKPKAGDKEKLSYIG
jgi:hypothetical protein